MNTVLRERAWVKTGRASTPGVAMESLPAYQSLRLFGNWSSRFQIGES